MKSKLKVVKIGGNIIDNAEVLDSFLSDFSEIEGPKVLVHGGGKLASRLSSVMGVEVKMIDGRRITDDQTLDIITMVYAGKINKDIVAKLQKFNCNALGLTGADANIIRSEKRPVKEIDYGWVGDVKGVDHHILKTFIEANITPVFCAITHDGKGQLLNTNADTIASELSIGLSNVYEVDLYYCFEKAGVLRDVADDQSVMEDINSKNYPTLVENGTIADGMLPKMKNCFHALENGVTEVHIGLPNMIFGKDTVHTTLTL
ncbi:acetylglutamate kinase [Aegicerativicinus sediminis]